MTDDKRDINNGGGAEASGFGSADVGAEVEDGFGSSSIASADDWAGNRGGLDVTSLGSPRAETIYATEIVPEHLDELPDIDNVEEYVGEDHVYDEETAGALVALMFAKAHSDDDQTTTSREPKKPKAPREDRAATVTEASAPSPERKKHKKAIWITAVIVAMLLLTATVFLYPMLFAEKTVKTYKSFEYTESENTVTITKYNGADTELVIPATIQGKSVVAIDFSAFANSESLETVVISDGIKSIGSFAFYNCTNLTSVQIPDSVTVMSDYAFSYCYRLTSVVIGDGLTNIGANAFYDCTRLANVVIPDSVTEIGYSAFYNCNGLTDMIIPDGVTLIGDSAFESCSGLTEVIIPDSVTTISYDAFRDCPNLTIYCETESKPVDWHSSWNSHNRPVVWGYIPE